jgi:UDP-N-acetylmuramoyl-L-alanyl-D-glutamate--2,6-diaminopimelate ligase
MHLEKILKNISYREIIGDMEKEVLSITQDSRDIQMKGGLYFAIIGTQVNGHDYIKDTINKGVAVIVCSDLPAHIHDNISYVVVENVAKEMGKMASNFYDNPSEKIKVVAVTGTNGKTSVATFLAQSLESLGKKTLLLSTAGDYYQGKEITIHRKAPSSLEVIELHKILAEYTEQGAEYCCLEATSQGLHQQRLSGVNIDVALFTNLADDHLDYHGTMLNYANAKRLLFDNLTNLCISISNIDDEYGLYMLENTLAKKIFYGSHIGDYIFDIKKMSLSGLTMTINNREIQTPLIGEFNAYNISLVFACLSELGFDNNEIVKALLSIHGVPGRMEMITNNKNILALVDYAHSADALENVLTTLGIIPHAKIITVIGCGGDRDTTKRAPMASVSQRLSSYVIYTSDNPRTESLDTIFKDMMHGVDVSYENFEFIASRETAIKTAVEHAQVNDIILIAGKGHEDYQIIGTEKISFDDKKVLARYLK